MEEKLKRSVRQAAAVVFLAGSMVYTAGWIKGAYGVIRGAKK